MSTKLESKVEFYVPMHGPLRAGLVMQNNAIVLDSHPRPDRGPCGYWADGPQLYIREEGIVLAYTNGMWPEAPFATWNYYIQQRRISLPDGLETWEETIMFQHGNYSMTMYEAWNDMRRRVSRLKRQS